MLAYDMSAVIRYSVEEGFDISLDRSHPMGYHLTSFNHMMGVRFDNDTESRDYTGEDDYCLDRDQEERLGYTFKFFGDGCDALSEGDCEAEGGDTASFAMLREIDFVGIDPTPNDRADTAGNRYGNVTCHEHDGCARGTLIPYARYYPLDNIAEYWMNQWRNDIEGSKADAVKLGPVLHVAQDAFEPHHISNFLGRGHQVFEGWAADVIKSRADCTGDNAYPHCDLDFIRKALYDPAKVDAYLNDYFVQQFDTENTPEKILTDAAWQAVRWEEIWYPGEGANEIHRLNEYSPSYHDATIWRADDEEIGGSYILNLGWKSLLATGHNLSVASTVTMLKKAFSEYKDHWAAQGYCSDLRAQDEIAWYQTLPGPWAGASLSVIPASQENYVQIIDALNHEINTAETKHPYYNDHENDPSNQVIFSVPYLALIMGETVTDSFKLTFDERTDWHSETEGDRIVISVMYYLSDEGRMGDWTHWATYANKDELLAEQPIRIEGFPVHRRLAKVKVELVQGANEIFVGGSDGLIATLNSQGLEPMNNNTADTITGLWGSSGKDIYATSNTGYSGGIFHYNGDPEVGWYVQVDPNSTSGFNGIWGLNQDNVYAVGDERVGYVWRFDGTDWSEFYRTDILLYYRHINGIWGSSTENLFAVGGWGGIYRFDGDGWETEHIHVHFNWNGVWGFSADDVFVLGDKGRIDHFDGNVWTPMQSGTGKVLNALWGMDGRLFAVGNDGVILTLEDGDWIAMDSGTTANLHAIWGSHSSDVYVVGQAGTMLHYNGWCWQQLYTGTDTDLHAVWGATHGCTPEAKFGFRITHAIAEYHETGRTPPNDDSIQIAEELAVWLKNIQYGNPFGALGVLWECLPGMPCDDELQIVLGNLFLPYFEQNIPLESEQVFDLVHEGLSLVMPDKLIHPALVAYVVMDAAYDASAKKNINDSLLTSQAIGWSLDRQGLLWRKATKGTLYLTAHLNFDAQPTGSRVALYSADGSGLPGVEAPNTDGYPGFRDPTEEELGSWDGLFDYYRAQRKDLAEYAWQNRNAKILANIDARLAILDTYDGSDPDTTERIEEIRTKLQVAQDGLEQLKDEDGDGISGLFDQCPDTCARGLDVDMNGCLDDVCDLESHLTDLKAWWVPKMVLARHANKACAMASRGKPKAAAGQLKAFVKQVRAYTRIGWVDRDQAQRLIAFVESARKVVLGQLEDLLCE